MALVYGDHQRSKRVDLWNWMEGNLPTGHWLIYGDFNHTKFIGEFGLLLSFMDKKDVSRTNLWINSI